MAWKGDGFHLSSRILATSESPGASVPLSRGQKHLALRGDDLIKILVVSSMRNVS